MRKRNLAIILTTTILFSVFLQVGGVSALSSNPVLSMVNIGSAKTQWLYMHSVSHASKIVIELGGGGVGYGVDMLHPISVQVTILNNVGVGGIFVDGEINELILESFPRQLTLTIGDPLGAQVGEWLNEAVTWAWAQGYTEVWGMGYSAGSTVWARYALSDEYGHEHLENETVTGIILKAYANQSCTECYLNARNLTLPVLFLSGVNDTVAPLVGVQDFYGRISSTTKLIVTYPTTHQGMAEVLPVVEQEWLLNEPITVSETNNPFILLFTVLMMPIPLTYFRRKNKEFRGKLY